MREETKYMCLRWLATHIALRRRAVRNAVGFAANSEALAGRQKEIAFVLELPVQTPTGSTAEAATLA